MKPTSSSGLSLSIGLALVMAMPASAASPPVPVARNHAIAPAAPPAAPVWTVDKAASRLSFKARTQGAGFDGVFKRWDAQIAFDPRNLKASRLLVTVDLTSALTGDPVRDQALPSPDWFWTHRYPKAVFTSRSLTAAKLGHYVASGDLTVRGVKRRVTLPFSWSVTKDVARVSGTTTLDRTLFGVGAGKTAAAVAPQVELVVRLSAKRGT